MKLMRIKSYIYIVLAVVLLASCSTTKYVEDGDYLLDKVLVDIDGNYPDLKSANLIDYVRQKENARWFSTAKMPLAFYSLSGRDTTKWINNTLKAMGEPPVIYDSELAKISCEDLSLQMQNFGYLRASTEAKTEIKDKKLTLTYKLNPGEPYFLRYVDYEIRDSVIADIEEITDRQKRLIKEYKRFRVSDLDAERKRITTYLNNRGYYKFNKDYIFFEADTVPGERFVDLKLVLNKHIAGNADTLHSRYKINTINYINAEDNNSKLGLRSKVLKNNTFLKEGEYYSLKDLRKTYERFGRLQAVKYTNISFRELPYGELLDCDIYINTNKANTISFQPEGTNTAGDLGAAVRLEYMNRNLFKGSELLSIDLRGAYEAITGLEGYNNDNFEEYTVETSLMFPRFIAPFLARSFRRRINATSEVALMYDLQNRPEYHRRVLSGAWRYKWNDANHHDRYQIDLLDINYVFMPWISDKFREDYLDDNTNRNAILRYNYEDLLIMKFGFRYSYNNGLYAIRANIETAGNVLGAISNIANLKKNELGQNKIFNIAYAQYVKGDFDYTKYFKFDETNTLVFHTGLGIAYPYDNSTILPFEKRYFSGGANSVRGWSVRSLGPGRYVGKDGNIDFINQTGDIKLDLNLEYRTHLFWKLDGALFVDAGNIWTFRDYKDQPGGQFDIATFYEQLAVSYGMGFRFNFDFFILRFDMGMKAIDPAYTGKDHYPILKHKMSRDFAFHFAVGMPF